MGADFLILQISWYLYGIYFRYIFRHLAIVINAVEILVVFIFSTSWGLARYFSKLYQYDDFFKNDPKLGENKAQFEKQNEVWFFLFRLIFNGGFLSQKWTGTSFDKECGAFSFAFGVELDYRCWRKCFISPTSPIELNTKNKLPAPPQFRFCLYCSTIPNL